MYCLRFIRSLFSLLLVMSIGQNLYGAESITLSGIVYDNKTGEAIPYVNITDTVHHVYTIADSLGRFSIPLQSGITYLFSFSFIGYKDVFREIISGTDITLDIRLEPDNQLQEVLVLSQKLSKTAEMDRSGMTTLSAATVQRLPAFMGEKDILKAVLLTPGVQSGNEGSRGIFVRGGSPDQSLVLFHRAPVYNVAHLYGFLSVFNTEAVDKLDLHKGYMPATYGGRLGAVVQVSPSYGNDETWKGSVGIGFITSKFQVEGPLKKGRTSLNIVLRECHGGLFSEPLSKKQFTRNKPQDIRTGSIRYYFYDLNAAIRHKVNDKNTLSWSFYNGSDFYTIRQSFEFPLEKNYFKDVSRKKLEWMNTGSTLEWATRLKKATIAHYYTFSFYRLRSNQNLSSEYRQYEPVFNAILNTDYRNNSSIMENAWQTDIQQELHPMHRLNYGIRISHRMFRVNDVWLTYRDSTGRAIQQDTFSNPRLSSIEFYPYLEYTFRWNDKIELKTSTQLFLYHNQGKSFLYPQPRAEVLYHPIRIFTLRASVNRSVQAMHLLTNNTGDVQNDTWVPATRRITPQTGWQYSGGFQIDHPKGYTASIDGYYRTMAHLAEYKYGSTFILDRIPWEEQLYNDGRGTAYGAEFFFAKTKGQFTAWLKYNLGWSTRQFPGLNQGKTYFYKYDRRHDVSIVLQYKLKKHFDFTIAWTYGSGWRFTSPSAQFASDQTLQEYERSDEPLYGVQQMNNYWNERNNYVTPAYHHLDISMNYTKQGKKGTHQFNASIYNLYARRNVFTIYREIDRDENGNPVRKYIKLSMFPIIPSLSYQFTFEFKRKR